MKPKKKTCRAPGCAIKFIPRSSLQKACSWQCALVLVEIAKKKDAAEAAKVDRAETRKAKELLKTRGQHIKDAQAWFNKFIRLRDDKEPCISCQKYINGMAYAGHYFTTAARPDLRFNEDNCHKQDYSCNISKSGNITEYRPNLVAKIGQDRVDALEGPPGKSNWTIEEINSIKELYKKKYNALRKVTASLW